MEIRLSYSFIAIYLVLPETEERSLEEIEAHFSDKTKGLFDINIRKLGDHSTTNDRTRTLCCIR